MGAVGRARQRELGRARRPAGRGRVGRAALALGALAALCGAVRSSAPLLAAAFSLLALTAVAEAAAAWWGAAHRPELRRALHDALDHTVRHEYGVLPSRTQLLDVIQQGLECCGAAGPRDWQHSAWARAAAGAPPASEAALDLSVAAPALYYWVPPSCCVPSLDAEACEAARRVAGASAGGAGLQGAACGPRLLAALARLARAPLALGAALLALHAAALPLAAALWLRAHPRPAYKA
ncbi:hypothetical protein HF086_002683 [Spodoptera exigua]|uniref:Tetraspanin n=1 Tax=Spodoptera exigua TaxID=7107 RepID=A0A922N087_SPOEX|nr:hypothetical protein HF086_002683 [Spodoptera exigua]